MPGDHKKSNPVLLITAVLLCLSPCMAFTQSAADPAHINDENTSDDSFISVPSDDSGSASDDSSDISATVAPTSTPVPTTLKPSKEASSGIWTSNGSNWLFMVNGSPYTGWLTDTDGKRYYFNSDGIMQTGWLDYKGKRYYLDLDGIMQTGNVTIDGQTYHFLDDGSLK